MAAPSNTVWGSVDGQGKLGIAVSASSTNTQTTLTVDVWLAVRYNIDDSYNEYSFSYTNNSGTTSTSSDSDLVLDFGTTSGAGWADASQKKIKTHTLTYDKGTSSKTVKFSASLNNLGSEEYDVSASTSYTIPALASYTISYNANGGSGVPSSQTKYYGKTLTLSSTKPTRSGYTFVGWGTSTTDTTADYSAGGSYTANASDTLYAIWKKDITLTYNANGGSGTPSSQSATIYNATTSYKFTLSSTKPTRTGYTFLGWSTSNTATSSSYAAGGSITLSASDTLYAVWSENALTVNYYSNYANYGTYQGEALSVSSSTNVHVATSNFLYDNSYTNGLSDVQNTSYLYLSRAGYTSTGYWGTSTSGGTLVDQKTSYSTGQALAQAFGKSLANGNASVNVYPQWKVNTYTLAYNSNGGSGNMGSQTVDWGEDFTIPTNTFKREGYRCIGYNVQRSSDSKWYVTGQRWQSESDIESNGYVKKLYAEGEDNHTMGTSWTDGTTETDTFTFYAVWEISGVVYIDNGSTFEPYLAYIDNGTDWELYLAYVDNGTTWNIIS